MDKNTYYKVCIFQNDIYDATMQAAEILDFDSNHSTLTVVQRSVINYVWGLLLEAHNMVKDLEK